ncbi:hypothetical protein ACHAW6_008827, partial [Cyclotella cf. meneghiniana]
MKEVVRFQHAALGFPTKAMLLTAIWHGNLITFPGLTTANITKYFPEANEIKEDKKIIFAYQAIHGRWKATGVICPNWQVQDNEAPEDLKQAIRENGCRLELTPADHHRQNAAERAIQTFKGHFSSLLAVVSDDFLITQWDKLLPQTVLTLNLFRQANISPNILAYAYHHGSFDYKQRPLTPMECAVHFHIKPIRRKTWGKHSSDS